jgi:hypothetical protein
MTGETGLGEKRVYLCGGPKGTGKVFFKHFSHTLPIISSPRLHFPIHFCTTTDVIQ